jgi:hypothetical protein
MKRALLAALLLGLAFWKPSLGSQWFRRVNRAFSALARRPGLSVLCVGLASFVLSAVITSVLGISPPHIHDEFANLLAADTFAHGRLSNPPHPLWIHFEEVHVLSQPAHISKYPPLQGLFLALGQVIGGQPVIGMWLSAALACAGTCWMLQAWVPARWALLGGFLAVVHPQILKWSQVYWGGSEAWFGGVLLLGGFRRLLGDAFASRPRAARVAPHSAPAWQTAAWMGVGMMFLAVSRPYEGFVLSLLVMLALFGWMLSSRGPAWRVSLFSILLPIVLLMLVLVGALGFYNVRTTGKVARMPYMLYEEQYAVAPFMVWQKPRPEPVYHHRFIRDHMIDYALMEYQRQQTPAGLARETGWKFMNVLRGFFWDFNPTWLWLCSLALLLATVPAMVRRDRAMQFALLLVAVFALALSLETWMWPRYAAPAAGLFCLVTIQALRRLSVWRWRRRPTGRFLVRAMVGLGFVCVLFWCRARAAEYALNDWDSQRLAMIKRLQAEGGRHVIFVRYGPRQSVHDDWVHNDADIDASPVIWARDMGEAGNRKVIDYFKDRKFWLLESEFTVDREATGRIPTAQLVPYAAPILQ